MQRSWRSPSTARDEDLCEKSAFQATYTTRGVQKKNLEGAEGEQRARTKVIRRRNAIIGDQLRMEDERHALRIPSGGGPGPAKREAAARTRTFSARVQSVDQAIGKLKQRFSARSRSSSSNEGSLSLPNISESSSSVFDPEETDQGASQELAPATRFQFEPDTPQTYEDSSDDVATTEDDSFYPNFENAQPGTFPVFDEEGFFTINCDFSPLRANYSKKIGRYAVQVDTELPLKELVDRKLSLDYLPTHCFPKTGCYLMKNRKGSTEPQKMYPIPPGHWAQVQQSKGRDDAKTHVRNKGTSLKVYHPQSQRLLETGDKMEVFKCQPGWFFYYRRIYALPEGYYICAEDPIYLPQIAEFSRQLRCKNTKLYRLPKPIVEMCVKKHWLPSVGVRHTNEIQAFVNNPNYLRIAAYHAEKLKIDEFLFLKMFVAHLRVKMERFINFDDYLGIVQMLEVFNYRMQRVVLRRYLGPAPPLHTLQLLDDPVLRRNLKMKPSISEGIKRPNDLDERPMYTVSKLFRDQEDEPSQHAKFKEPPDYCQKLNPEMRPLSSTTYLKDPKMASALAIEPRGDPGSLRYTARSAAKAKKPVVYWSSEETEVGKDDEEPLEHTGSRKRYVPPQGYYKHRSSEPLDDAQRSSSSAVQRPSSVGGLRRSTSRTQKTSSSAGTHPRTPTRYVLKRRWSELQTKNFQFC